MNDPYRNHSSFLCYTNASVYHTILVSQVICQLYNKVMRPIALSLCLHCCFSPTKPSFIKTKSFDFRFWQTEDSSAVLFMFIPSCCYFNYYCKLYSACSYTEMLFAIHPQYSNWKSTFSCKETPDRDKSLNLN